MERTPINHSQRIISSLRRSARLSAASKQKSTIKTSNTNKSATEKKKEKEEEKKTGFDCNICLDGAKEAVVTCCGHLYCWPCLFQWLQTPSKECPVCKGGINESSIVPIYGGSVGSNEREEDDEGLMVPPRPQGKRVDSFMQDMHAPRWHNSLGHEFTDWVHSESADNNFSLGRNDNGEDYPRIIIRRRVRDQSSVDASFNGMRRLRIGLQVNY